MHAWVAGATGLVGSSLIRLLLEEPRVERVTALVRRRSLSSHPKLDERQVDFEALAAELAGLSVTHVFCCLGTTAAKAGSDAAFRRVDHDYPLELGRAAIQAHAKAFLLVSSVGADAHSGIFYSRVKGETEAALRDLGLPALHIFRPSLLLGQRSEYRSGEQLSAALMKPLSKLMLGPLRKYRPVEAERVAQAMVNAALSSPKHGGAAVYEGEQIVRLAAEQPR
jgi:uncharacterized protein YbjT (DUF2867 family)